MIFLEFMDSHAFVLEKLANGFIDLGVNKSKEGIIIFFLLIILLNLSQSHDKLHVIILTFQLFFNQS